MSLQQPNLLKAASLTPLLGMVTLQRPRACTPTLGLRRSTPMRGHPRQVQTFGPRATGPASRRANSLVRLASSRPLIAESHDWNFLLPVVQLSPRLAAVAMSDQGLSGASAMKCGKSSNAVNGCLATSGRENLPRGNFVASFGALRAIGPLSLHLQFGNCCQTSPIRFSPLAVSAIFDPKPNRYGPRARLR